MAHMCSHCRAVTPLDARFCPSCGETQGVTQLGDRTVVSRGRTLRTSQTSRNDGATVQARTPANDGRTRIMGCESARALHTQREVLMSVIDVSGSMQQPYDDRYSKLQAAGRANLTMVVNKAKIDPHDEIGLVTFDSRATLEVPPVSMATDKHALISALQSLSSGGGTDINAGLKAARDAFEWGRADVIRRIVLLTDGHGGHPLHTAEDLKSRGVVIDVIGVGDCSRNVEEGLLRAVASVVEGECRYRFIKDQHTLVDHCTHLAGKTRTTAYRV